MTYQRSSHVICLGDVKQAALYFEKVIPVNINQLQEHSNPAQLTRDLIDSFGSSNRFINDKFLNTIENIHSSLKEMHLIITKLLFFKKNDADAYNKELSKLPLNNRVAASKFLDFFISSIENETKDTFIKELSNNLLGFLYMEGAETHNGDKFRTLIDQLNSLTNSKYCSVLLPEKCLLNQERQDCDISLLFSNLNLIDTSGASWEKILEFRKDKDSSNKLRNFRLFFENNYKGKDPKFIKDDLMKRLYDYEQVTKEWRFQTISSTIGLVLDAKNILAVSGAAILLSISFGKPIGINEFLISGALIESAKISLHVAKSLHSFRCEKNRNDLAYIIEGKRKME